MSSWRMETQASLGIKPLLVLRLASMCVSRGRHKGDAQLKIQIPGPCPRPIESELSGAEAQAAMWLASFQTVFIHSRDCQLLASVARSGQAGPACDSSQSPQLPAEGLALA